MAEKNAKPKTVAFAPFKCCGVYMYYRVIRGRCIYWVSDAEPRESGSSVVRAETRG